MFSPKPARYRAALISMTLLAGGGLLTVAAPAQAASINGTLPQLSVAYTDSADPAQAYPDPTGDLPLGAWTDTAGTTHVSRIYATYDLSGYVGESLLGVDVGVRVDQGTDCSAGDIQVWQTALPAQTPTWAQAPAQKKQLGGIGLTRCSNAYVYLDVTAAATAALASGQHQLAIELRLSDADEKNVSLGRQVTAPIAQVSYDTKPAKPVQLFNDYRACSTSQTAPDYVPTGYGSSLEGQSVLLEGQVSDPDTQDVTLNADYLIWPVTDTTDVTTLTANNRNGFEVGVDTPAGLVADGQTYGWQMRSDDGQEQSAWTKTCYFTVDTTRPSAAPTITSSNYPAGTLDQAGKPIKFTFGANGVSDVGGYEFSWQQTLSVPVVSIGTYGIPGPSSPYTDKQDFVKASALGGTANVSLIPPSTYSFGSITLYVVSLDRAYNESGVATYTFSMTNTAPTISPATLPYDTPTVVTLTPNKAVGKVTSYTVQVGYQKQTVQAAADGTAQVTINPVSVNNPDGSVVTVTSTSASGWISSQAEQFDYYDTTPTVSSDVYLEEGSTPDTNGGVGIPGTFTASLALPNIASFTYSFDGDTPVTVPADSTGTANLSWAPDSSGSHMLVVNANNTEGGVLDSYYYFFDVN